MWPPAFQLTRDECRGILRRLELESYANVISVLRAQGGLSDTKAKLLEDLRSVFHISQERHRAEARRVANDEQLSTIAEAISGPNTWQEWSREGRRTYPLLPRVPPQTALSIVANSVAAEVTNENSKLPYPTETIVKQQHQEFITERISESVPVVTSDPLQPEVPEIRKTLKRNLPPDTIPNITSTKKRILSESSPSATANDLPLSPTTQIRKLYHNHSKTQTKQRNSATKKSTNNSPTKRLGAASKRRLISGDSTDPSNKPNSLNVTTFPIPNNTSQPLISPTPAPISSQIVSAESLPLPTPPLPASLPPTLASESLPIETNEKTLATPPQIATSKKDISKNLSKLNINQQSVQPPQSSQPDKVPECKTEKLSTPVQKYIVEERAPMLLSTADKQQVITSKIKPMTAIVPTPLSSASKAKITNVKSLKNSDIVCSTPVSSQPQVFNVIDANTPFLPHTPPAIINISSKFEPEHGKVLTTKLLPLMLSTGSKVDPSNGNPVHMKNITHVSPSTTTTVFRKPNIIKSSVPMKQKIQITNQQIISPPNVASLKMSPHLHLKGVPGGGPIYNRKSVKIVSSPNGKMFIQSADSAAKSVGKVNTIVTAQKGSGHIVSPTSAPNRIAIQKVQIISAPNTSTGSTVPKPIAIAKPNMIYMASAPTVKGLPIVKGNKFTAVLPTTVAQEAPVTSVTSAKSNVFVIGAVQSSPQTILSKDIQGFNSRSNMITEDTPVDIITTPIIVDVDSIEAQESKPTDTVDLTEASGGSGGGGGGGGLTTAVTTEKPTSSPSKPKIQSTVLQCRTVQGTATYVESANKNTTEDGESHQMHQTAAEGQNAAGAVLMGATDWEMELDQEANKNRVLNAQKSHHNSGSASSTGTVENIIVASGGEECGSSDEHFVEDDVIEEQEETEEEMDDGCETAGDSVANNKSEQHLIEEEEGQRLHHHHSQNNDEDDEETIEVGDEHMKTESDVIQYDESYESANDDMDENIAIEYVEEDQDGYEEKIDSTSNDRKETMECNSNIVLIKQSTNHSADPLESSNENKNQSSSDCMVSVEEISSTTQQNVYSSPEDH